MPEGEGPGGHSSGEGDVPFLEFRGLGVGRAGQQTPQGLELIGTVLPCWEVRPPLNLEAQGRSEAWGRCPGSGQGAHGGSALEGP